MADDIKRITGAVEDAVAYPILTQQISPSQPSTQTGVNAPGGGPSVTTIAQNAMRQLLGWRYKADDPRGFVAALTKSFNLKQVGDFTQWQLQQQSYSALADLGDVTGAQASIYARAKVALEQVSPTVIGLLPLRPDFDAEDVQSMQSIVQAELTQLVGELGVPTGPRVQRVESFFKLLLGPEPDYRDPNNVKGHLGQLGDRLGMSRDYVNTIADEQNLTNFLIVVDYVNSLNQTWVSQRDFFSRGLKGEPFLGNQLLLLSEGLAAAVDAIQDAYEIMDSVFLGAPERQATNLLFYGEEAPITLQELLDWAQKFSSEEGPALLQDSGKDGVIAFRSTLVRLNYLLFLTVQLSRSSSWNPSHSFHTFRVLRSLQEVQDYMRLAYSEAEKIRRREKDDKPNRTPPAPVVTNVEASWVGGPPGAGLLGTVQVTVLGNDFSEGAGLAVRVISASNPAQGLKATIQPGSFVKTEVPRQPPVTAVTARVTGVPVPAPPTAVGAPPAIDTWIVVVVNNDGQVGWLAHGLMVDSTTDVYGGTGIPSAGVQGILPIPYIAGPLLTAKIGTTTALSLTASAISLPTPPGPGFPDGTTLSFNPAQLGKAAITAMEIQQAGQVIKFKLRIPKTVVAGNYDLTLLIPGYQDWPLTGILNVTP